MSLMPDEISATLIVIWKREDGLLCRKLMCENSEARDAYSPGKDLYFTFKLYNRSLHLRY